MRHSGFPFVAQLETKRKLKQQASSSSAATVNSNDSKASKDKDGKGAGAAVAMSKEEEDELLSGGAPPLLKAGPIGQAAAYILAKVVALEEKNPGKCGNELIFL